MSMANTDQAASGLLASLTPAEAEELRSRGRRRAYRRGTVLYHEEDPSDWVILVEEGRVKASTVQLEGREAILAILGPGELVGELSAFDGRPRSATVTALEDVTATVVTAPAFRDFLQAHPRVGVLLLEMLSCRLRDTDRKRVEFGVYDIAARVSRRLVELAERFGEPDGEGLQIDLPLTQEELAGWVGASREGVSKALGTLRTRGWIETRRRGVVIHDLEALRRRSR